MLLLAVAGPAKEKLTKRDGFHSTRTGEERANIRQRNDFAVLGVDPTPAEVEAAKKAREASRKKGSRATKSA